MGCLIRVHRRLYRPFATPILVHGINTLVDGGTAGDMDYVSSLYTDFPIGSAGCGYYHLYCAFFPVPFASCCLSRRLS